ncbi:MAG: MBL fold metallo-hydrolase [Gemmataceae bacterium]|nr:MBL fold metallo-hydrolase [Gemmataceae bacterium]
MHRWSFVLVAVFALFPFASAQEKGTTVPLVVTWHGQSFFTVKSPKGTTIAFDPHFVTAYGRPEGLKADAVTISHNHTDHTALYVIENAKEAKVLRGLTERANKTAEWAPVDTAVKDAKIYSVNLYHDSSEGMQRGKNAAFVVELDGWRICHLGDLGHKLTPEQLKKIGKVDVLMVPVGGIYTLNGSEAQEVVEQIRPKEYIFPMHYGTKVFDEVLPVTEFLDGVEKARIAVSDDNKVTLNRDPQRPRPLIVQLHYWPKGK